MRQYLAVSLCRLPFQNKVQNLFLASKQSGQSKLKAGVQWWQFTKPPKCKSYCRVNTRQIIATIWNKLKWWIKWWRNYRLLKYIQIVKRNTSHHFSNNKKLNISLLSNYSVFTLFSSSEILSKSEPLNRTIGSMTLIWATDWKKGKCQFPSVHLWQKTIFTL